MKQNKNIKRKTEFFKSSKINNKMRTLKRYILSFIFVIIFKIIIWLIFGSNQIDYKYKVQKLPECIIIGEKKCGINYNNF
jgi:heme/copper-type cytochrome/quinol oxidase subunit 4